MWKRFFKSLKILWASPNTLLGLAIGVFGLCLGSQAQFRFGCVEFYGGLVQRILGRSPIGGGAAAMTLGHVVLGQTQGDLDRCRDHEHVHVRQYERWGPFFLPAYLGCSVMLWFRGKDAYLENPFEIEAYSIADPGRSSSPGNSPN